MTKLKKFTDFMNSLRFRLVLLLILIGVIPCVLLRIGMLNSYENRAVSLRTSEILSQAKILANQIVSNDYLENSGSPTINAQLEQLSTIYDGRVMIISDTFQVVKDTYKLDEKKTIISEEVIKSFYGEEITKYDSKYRYIEMTIPLVRTDQENESRQVIGVMMVSVSTDSISLNLDYLATNTRIIELICIFTVIFASVIIAGQMVRPFHKMSKSIDEIQTGYGEDALSVNDYTETKLISEKFNKMLGRMKVLDDSRQEFVSNVSHELKTPITSMKVLADYLIQNESADLAMYKEFMTDIVDEIDRESKIITDLLTLVKMDKKSAAMNIEEIKINDLLEVILKRVTPIAKSRGIQITYESYRDVTAWVDEVKLSLALTNIIENAVKYNVDNGWVKVTLNADHRNFYVKVADSGVGIPDDCKEHVFERFYRVDKARSRDTGGTGLGLAITKSVIQMHKGSIKLYSESGEGTTFTIRIPMKSDASVDTARKEGDAE